ERGVGSTAGPAPSSFVRRRLLIPTITRLSDMATVARGCGMGRLLVPNLALFVTEKLPHQKARTTSQPRQSSVLLSDDRAVQGFTSDLSSCSITLHDFIKRVCAHHSGSLRKWHSVRDAVHPTRRDRA